MKKSLAVLIALSFLAASCLNEPYSGAAATEDSWVTKAPLLLSMPEEYINYAITMVHGEFCVEIDGTYPISVLRNAFEDPLESLLLLYPVPPGTTNIQLELDDTELQWSNYTQTFPAAMHHTAIGDWQMINCTLSQVPDSFILKIHYEHPLATANGSHLFLYDLNLEPYLSPQSPNSTAYFTIRTNLNLMNLKAYTTETDTVWNPIDYATSYEGTTQVFSIQIQSDYSKPVAGDLVVTFNGDATTKSPSLPVLALLAAAIFAVVALLFTYHKRRRAGI